MADPAYSLDFLFNDIVDVHFGSDYLVFKGYGQETGTQMATWLDGLFFDSQGANNFSMGYDNPSNQLTYAGMSGSIRIVRGGVFENDVKLQGSDLSGKLKTANGATLKNSFLVGIINGNSNATLAAFISTENLKTQKLEVNSVPEQPVTYRLQLFTLRAKDVGPGVKMGSLLPGKAVSQSRLVDGGNIAKFNFNVDTLKITNL